MMNFKPQPFKLTHLSRGRKTTVGYERSDINLEDFVQAVLDICKVSGFSYKSILECFSDELELNTKNNETT